MTFDGFTLNEMLAALLASDFKDKEVGFTGLSTGHAGAKFVNTIPWAAMALARFTHAPNLTMIVTGWKINPDIGAIERLPVGEFDSFMADVPCEAHSKGYPVHSWLMKRGEISFSFSSGAQVDRQGNINSVVVGDYAKPKVRLVGPILQPEHMSLFGREYIMVPVHERRRFVEKVDYVSGTGYPGGLEGRRKLGLERGGPELIITPKCIFDFDKDAGQMRLRSLHPGVTFEDVQDNTGIDLGAKRDVPTTPVPSAEQLHILRTAVDPNGILL